MGIILRQSFKGTIVSYLGVLIGMVNVLWFFPKFLQPEQIGLIRLLQDFPLLLGSLIQFGAANVADRFFPYFKTEDGRDRGFFVLLIVYPLVGFLFFLILFFSFYDFWISFYQDKSPLLVKYFMYVAPLAFFIMYISVLEAYARVNLRIVVPGIIREIFTRILFSLIIILYFMHVLDWQFFMKAFVGIYACSLLFLAFYLRQLRKIYWQPDFNFLTKPLLKDIFSFVLYIIPGSAGGLIAAKIDTIMLGSKEGLASTGIYSIAFFVGAVVEMPKRALSQIAIPILSRAWKANDLKTIDTIYKKSSLNQFIIGLFIFLGIWINVDELLALIPHPEIYREGKYVIFFIGISKLIEMGTGVNTEIILSSKYYRFNLIAMVFLSITTVVANLYLIPLYNIIGVAISLAFSIFIFNLMKSLFIWFKLKLQPFEISFLYVIIISSFCYIIIAFIPFNGKSFQDLIGIILIRSVLLTTIFFGLIWYYKLSVDFNNFINALIQKIKSFS